MREEMREPQAMIKPHGHSSQGGRTQNIFVPLPNNKPRPGLAVDTSFNRHQGQIPQQVYPKYTAKQQGFVSLSDLKALADVEDGRAKDRRGLKERLGKATRSQAPQNSLAGNNNRQRLVVDNRPMIEAPPPYNEPQARLLPQAPYQSRRTNGLPRPAPLNLSTDVSPSDRAIPIGIALPSAAIQDHGTGLESAFPRPDSLQQGWLSHQHGHELTTPTIIITPAEEDFESHFNASPEDFRRSSGYRSALSLQSRQTECKSNGRQFGQRPPMPPLPLVAVDDQSGYRTNLRDSAHTVFDEPSPLYSGPETSGTGLSTNTPLEDHHSDQSPFATAFSAKRRSSPAGVSTSRRSKGWWNIITSPFSASSASKGFSLRSPPILEDDERGFDRLLSGGSQMSRSGAYMFAGRPEGDEELRSAPPTDCKRPNFARRYIAMPKRSDTAPGALDMGNADEVNIYRTPSYGAASSYFDQNNRYSSRAPPPYDPTTSRGLTPDWSPSQSVYRDSRGPGAMGRGLNDERLSGWPTTASGEAATYHDRSPEFTNFSDLHPTARDSFIEEQDQFRELTPRSRVASNEGRTPYNSGPPALSPTPVLENARAARFIDPRSSHAKFRELDYNHDPLSGSAAELGSSAPDGCLESDFHDDSSEADTYPPPHRFNEKTHQPTWDASLGHRDLEESERSNRPWHHRLSWLLIGISALAVISLVALLIIFIPPQHDNLPVEAQWLNLTGFPPLATGVATVIGARSLKDVNGCINPAALWSCSVPPGQRLSTTQPDQPNFRFLIRFRNGTLSNETLLEPSKSTMGKRHSDMTTNASSVTRRGISMDYLFAALPSPPSTEDQIFLGRTTDKVNTPFNGEETPFYISLLDPIALRPVKRSRLHKRDFRYPYPTPSDAHSVGSGSSASASSVPTPSAAIPKTVPPPPTTGEGEPLAPQLYPLPYAQPLRLFNRGLPTEHYGFYTYFDRSIYVAGSITNNSLSDAVIGRSIVANVPLDKASTVCTWSQTRFLVQIWTRKTDVTRLGFMPNATSIPAVNSTANDMEAPGSFPYSVTVTLDRHGGDASQKGVYCYGLDSNHRVVSTLDTWVAENRAFDGTIVDPAAVPTNNGTSLRRRGNHGGSGIDGGAGGCACQWSNF